MPISDSLEQARLALTHLQDPTEQAIARKALLQLDVVNFPSTADRFDSANPIDFGPFRGYPTVAEIDFATQSGNLAIRRGEVYMDYHLLESESITLQSSNEGYVQMADFFEANPDILYAMGVTYKQMAMSAKRFQGFNMEEVDLPTPVMDLAQIYWKTVRPKSTEGQLAKAFVVWHTRQSFLERFSS